MLDPTSCWAQTYLRGISKLVFGQDFEKGYGEIHDFKFIPHVKLDAKTGQPVAAAAAKADAKEVVIEMPIGGRSTHSIGMSGPAPKAS